MELTQAIQRVAKVCPKKKDKANFQVVRFLPPQGDGPSYVYATDGLVTSLIKVDGDCLPNVLLPAGDLIKATKDSGEIKIVEDGYGQVSLITFFGVYRLQGKSFDCFPGLPRMPSSYTPISLGEWGDIRKVFHAAAKEAEDSELAVVHFTPDYVEATDKARLVRVNLSKEWSGLVSVSVFKSWPKGEVYVSFTETHAFFWVGDELRIGQLLNCPNYPKTASTIPGEHEGPYAVVSTRKIYEAAKQGAQLSDLGMVTLEFGDSLIIRAWSENQEASTYQAEIKIYDGSKHAGLFLITGKFLVEALAHVESRNIQLGYGGLSDPLRIDSGAYTACIWQLIYS